MRYRDGNRGRGFHRIDGIVTNYVYKFTRLMATQSLYWQSNVEPKNHFDVLSPHLL
jgi:hypothetical protein